MDGVSTAGNRESGRDMKVDIEASVDKRGLVNLKFAVSGQTFEFSMAAQDADFLAALIANTAHQSRTRTAELIKAARP